MMTVRLLLAWVLNIFLMLLLIRLVFDWIQMFARDWRPRGPLLVVAEAVYSVTDPPLRAVRKVIPPLRLGGVALDLSFMVVIFAIYLLRSLIL
ncbi:MAG: YggT family protein [Austwickia sp.]|nr:YggT family protein [Actinomycetota bacterium]MCB1253390.1 YggT family protein [Austwickia sp.]MCO5310525.1 YggT family protein [Austwickia sp.]